MSLEALDATFIKRFWQFIEGGGYQHRQISTGKQIFYRFSSPLDEEYPYMLELFSRRPDSIPPGLLGHLTPVSINDGVKGLSAILLDDAYYHFLHSGRQRVDGLSVVGAGHLIPLKAKAWLDLSARRQEGAPIDRQDIRKHRNDVLRLTQLLSSTTEISATPSIKQDMNAFMTQLETDPLLDLKSLGIRMREKDLFGLLRKIYGLA